MAKAYSYDLRTRVMTMIESGRSPQEVGKIYNISRKVIYDWKKLQKETGDFRPLKLNRHGQNWLVQREEDVQRMKVFFENNANLSSQELSERSPIQMSRRTILRLLHRLGYSYKKNILSSQNQHWIEK
jgi:transposase